MSKLPYRKLSPSLAEPTFPEPVQPRVAGVDRRDVVFLFQVWDQPVDLLVKRSLNVGGELVEAPDVPLAWGRVGGEDVNRAQNRNARAPINVR